MITIRPILLALATVVVCSAAGSGDYELRVDGEGPICAKSLATCEEAKGYLASPPAAYAPAVRDRRGRFMDAAAPGIAAECVPHPGCFSRRSNCVLGYRGPLKEGICP